MINTEFLEKCINSLELSYKLLQQQDKNTTLYNVYRSACVKEFELILEQSGKLLKKAMEPNFANNKELDALTFKDIFRYAHKHSLLDENAVLNWFEYRDSRNQTAHNYGEILAEITLGLVPKFIIDSKNLVLQIEKANVIKK
jgi:nucleotidyltransferase substrate binding protein (TIGR01987 family)